jgi:hypothetical protein
MEFVAVGRDDEVPPRMLVVDNQKDAHGMKPDLPGSVVQQ